MERPYQVLFIIFWALGLLHLGRISAYQSITFYGIYFHLFFIHISYYMIVLFGEINSLAKMLLHSHLTAEYFN